MGIKYNFETSLPLLSKEYSDDKTLEYVNSKNPLMLDLVNEEKPTSKKLTLKELANVGIMNK